jgi:methionyl-tRNA formyltransferase
MVQQPALRIVYFGTPEFAVPALRALADDDRYEVALVVTQPDRPAGRGQRLTPPPVKQAAEALDLPIYQPASLRSEAERQPLFAVQADLFVVAAFGLIFGRKTLAIPKIACVNLHASLLPKYRGASPVAAAIAAGDEETDISLMQMETGLDTGPVIATSKLKIAPTDTTESLTKRLAELGADLAVAKLADFASGRIQAIPQKNAGASIVRPLRKADGWLDWTKPAVELERWVRAMWPWPRAWTTVDGEPLQIHRASVVESRPDHHPGLVVATERGLAVQTSKDALQLELVQFAGGKPQDGKTLASMNRLIAGALLGRSGMPEPQPPFITALE